MATEEQLAEFVGIMLGDGHIGIYNTKFKDKIKVHRTLKVTLDSRNKEYASYVSQLLSEVLLTEIHHSYKKTENAVDLATHKKELLDFALNDLGLAQSPKWNKMKIPEKYSSGELSLYVLKGLFDTDGCLSVFNNNGTSYSRIEIRLCPSPAQEQINKILNEYNFIYTIQNLERGKSRIRISGKNQLQKWFNLIGSANPIHLNKAKKLIEF